MTGLVFGPLTGKEQHSNVLGGAPETIVPITGIAKNKQTTKQNIQQ